MDYNPCITNFLDFLIKGKEKRGREGGGKGRGVALFKESLHEKLGIRNSIFELSQTRVNVMSLI